MIKPVEAFGPTARLGQTGGVSPWHHPADDPAAVRPPVVVWRGRRLADAADLARRLRAEGIPCAVSAHPEPRWHWRPHVLGSCRILVDEEWRDHAREALRLLSHIDDAMTFETPDHRHPNRWRGVVRIVGVLLLLAMLSAAVGWGIQW